MIAREDGSLERVPRRSRMGLRPFNPPLAPRFEEVWIDKLRLSLRGGWVGAPSLYNEYRDFVALADPHITWIGQIRRTRRKLTIKSAAGDRHTTFSELKISVAADGLIKVELRCNPTRTLAHLMNGFVGDEGFVDWITEISPALFFRQYPSELPLAFGRTDNWIADFNRVKRLFGGLSVRYIPPNIL